MLSISSDNIITKLKTVTYSVPNTSIVAFFDSGAKTFPRIVVSQLDDSTKVRAMSSTGLREMASNVSFRIAVFTKDATVNSTVKNRNQVNDIIISEINSIMVDHYGFNRDMVSPIMSYDDSICVRYAYYSGVIDSSGYIYRDTGTRAQTM